MAITITAYTGFSKRINSTKQPSGGQNIDVVLKHPTSVIHPTFLISGFSTSWNYIAWGNRYYFVDDIIVVSNTQAEYICSLDVLATYKDVIGLSSQYVVRAASDYDQYIIDSRYATLADPVGLNMFMPNIEGDMYNTGGAYVLGTISGGTESGVSYYHLTYSDFEQFLDYMFAGSYLQSADIDVNLQKELLNPFQYIASCMWFPFLDGTGGHFGDTIKFGYWDSGCAGKLLDESERTYRQSDDLQLDEHPQAATRGKYLNGAPFTRRTIEVFGFGQIPLDPSWFVRNNNCTVMVKVDMFTGVGELTVESAGGTVLKTQAQLGVPIKISQVASSVIAPAISAIGAIGDIVTGNYLGAVKGVGNAVLSAVPQVQTSGMMGSKIDYLHAPRIVSQFYYVADEDNATIGRPLCKVKQINTLSGYIECENVDVDSVGTSAEKRAIIDFMEGGFFYE